MKGLLPFKSLQWSQSCCRLSIANLLITLCLNLFLNIGLNIIFISTSLAGDASNSLPPPFKGKVTGGNPTAIKGGILTYEAYEPAHLNPLTSKDAGASEVLNKWVFDSLLDNDVVTGDDIPSLAKTWSFSPDRRQITFQLDEKAKWFDGKPVTADDVRFSFEVYSLPGVNNPFRKSQTEAIEKIEILKPDLVRFHLRNSQFYHFEFIGSLMILPKHIYFYADPKVMESNEYTQLPKGSGPYVVKSLNKGDRTVLERNPNWWAGHLKQNIGAYNFDKIVLRYIRDPQIAFENLKKGDLDYMQIRVGNIELLRQTKTDKAFVEGKIKALDAASKLQEGFAYLGFNLKNELFVDKKVRKALAKALNREEMIQKSLDGAAVVPKGPLFSLNNFEGKFENVKFDPKAAQKELEDLGWKDTNGDYILDKKGKKFEFSVLVPNARIEKEMLYVQNYFKQIGVQMNIKRQEYQTWAQLQDERKFDSVSNGKNRLLKAFSTDAFGEWHSSNTKPGLRNYYGYSSPEVDKLIEKSQSEINPQKRKKLLDQINDLIAEDYVLIQYSESKYQTHGISAKLQTPEYQGKNWFPYNLGMKYWYFKQ